MNKNQETLQVIQKLIKLTDDGKCDWEETSQNNQYKLLIGLTEIYVSYNKSLIKSYSFDIYDLHGSRVTSENYVESDVSYQEVERLYKSILDFQTRKYKKKMREIGEQLDYLDKSQNVIA